MRKLNYFIVGLSQLIMGTMTIGFVSCEQNLEALDNCKPPIKYPLSLYL